MNIQVSNIWALILGLDYSDISLFFNITVKGENRDLPVKLKDTALQSTASDQSHKKPHLHLVLKGNKDFIFEEQINVEHLHKKMFL